jgi:glucose dehydrogenase
MIGVALAILVPGTSTGNSELMKLMDDPNNWAAATGNYAATRYSKLNQINKENVGDLQVAWTFSTGVLRGHEGGPYRWPGLFRPVCCAGTKVDHW